MKRLVAIIFLTAAFTAAAILYSVGLYPAAFIIASPDIGGSPHIIWARAVNRIAQITLLYYKTTLSTATSTLAITPAMQTETQHKSIEMLIEQTLIADAIKNIQADDDVETLLQKNIQAFAARAELNSAIMTLYGINGEDFIALVMRPEAEREILKQKNNEDDAAFTRWLTEEKEKAQIVRFLK